LLIWFLSGLILVILAVQVPPLIKGKQWKELAVYSALMLVASIYAYGHALDLNLPNPNRILAAIFGPLADWLEAWAADL